MVDVILIPCLPYSYRMIQETNHMTEGKKEKTPVHIVSLIFKSGLVGQKGHVVNFSFFWFVFVFKGEAAHVFFLLSRLKY